MDVCFNLVSSFLLLLSLYTSPMPPFLCLVLGFISTSCGLTHMPGLVTEAVLPPASPQDQAFRVLVQGQCWVPESCRGGPRVLPASAHRSTLDSVLWLHCSQGSHSNGNLYFLSEANIVVSFLFFLF